MSSNLTLSAKFHAPNEEGSESLQRPSIPGTVGRWGDYGAAVVDAATGFMYTANEMIPNPSLYKRGHYANWGTFISQIY